MNTHITGLQQISEVVSLVSDASLLLGLLFLFTIVLSVNYRLIENFLSPLPSNARSAIFITDD